MPSYTPPLRDMQFVLHEVFHVADAFQAMPAHADTDADTINAVLEEAGKFAANVTFPLNIVLPVSSLSISSFRPVAGPFASSSINPAKRGVSTLTTASRCPIS